MKEHSSTIDAVFEIDGRGCLIIPGIPYGIDSRVQIGDHVYILNGDDCIDTVVRGIQMIRAQRKIEGLPIFLPKTINKSDVTVGSKLYIVEQSPKDGVQNKSHFELNDPVHVRINARNHTARTGTIERKVWHHKYQIWYYFLREIRGRLVSKRYTAADLVAETNGT
jgi:hypothetical protein